MKYKSFGAHSILVEWPSKIDEVILKDILNFKEKILQKFHKQNIQINHAYNSLLISYNKSNKGFNHETTLLQDLYASKDTHQKSIFKLWKIPVCYDNSFALDLELISLEKGLSKSKIIQLHSEPIYTVFFIGFLPGFLYLGGLNDQLYTPRKATPRLDIVKGAVAIGGHQTGIYPNESPGGWNIIGNSPINFFDVNKPIPCFASAGDKIKFIPVSIDEYHSIKKLVELDAYELESEVMHG